MSTMNPLNSYKSMSNGMSGLISGLDTESMVEKLLSGTQAKIDKQNGAKQQLEWKQDAYREVTTLLSGFQDKFMSFLNPTTNIMSSSFFNAMSATSNSSAVKVRATANANAGTLKINEVRRLATTQKYEGHSAVSKELVGNMVPGKISIAGSKSIDITLDGIKKTIAIKGDTPDDVRVSLAAGIKDAFGSTNLTVTGTGDEIKFVVKSGSQVSVSGSVVNGELNSAGLEALGFKQNQSNKINTSASLKDLNLNQSLKTPLEGAAIPDSEDKAFKFTINGKIIEATDKDSINSIMEKVNTSGAGVKMTYSTITDKFSIEATESGAGRKISFEDVEGEGNKSKGNFLKSIFGSDTENLPKETVLGQNAVLIMADGTRIVRGTNSFELDGINIELLETTTTPIEIGTTRNTEQIFNGIKSFVEEYNSMIDKLHGMVGQDAMYKKYPPLTAAQKKEMSETEISAWEKKSKEGLLRNDSIINGVLGSMRSAMYEKPDGAKFAIYDLGIATGDWRGNGKLIIKDEAALKKLIETNSADIEKLFADSAAGLGAKMNTIIDKAAKKSSGSPGTLVQMAGVKGWTSGTNSTLARQMKNIDDTLTVLKRNYETEKSRYWKQFSAMEKVISNMNQQSSWLSSQLG